MTLSPISAPSTGAALRLLSLAHSQTLHASYHPHGGTDARRDTPVSHTVWVLGTDAQIKAFKESIR